MCSVSSVLHTPASAPVWYEKKNVYAQNCANEEAEADAVLLRAGRVHVSLHTRAAPEHGRQEHANLDGAEREPYRQMCHGQTKTKSRRPR